MISGSYEFNVSALKGKIIFWDNDGTVSGSVDPNDASGAKVILPGVVDAMQMADFNLIISGVKTDNEIDFDGDLLVEKFADMMQKMPIAAAAFSPRAHGAECWVVLFVDGALQTIKAHEDDRYKEYINSFKKPGIGMFVVLSDIVEEFFSRKVGPENSVMIGDLPQDMEGAVAFGIPFVPADFIHRSAKRLI